MSNETNHMLCVCVSVTPNLMSYSNHYQTKSITCVTSLLKHGIVFCMSCMCKISVDGSKIEDVYTVSVQYSSKFFYYSY